MSRERIHELLDTFNRTTDGSRALIDEAVSLAVEMGEEELEYRARMELISAAQFAGDTDAALTSFAWCLAKHDSDPGRFPDTSLLWQYKWMANNLSNSPAFTRAEVDAVLEDMRVHYEHAGLGMSAVYMVRFQDAWVNGRHEEADALRATLLATPRDSHSDCQACVHSEVGGFLVDAGREAEALTLVDEMIARGLGCAEEPEHALARSLLPLLRAGRLEEAKAAHLRGYRMARDNPNNIAMIAHHLAFCAVTGNEARGLALVERHLSWLAHDALDAVGQFGYLLAQAALLDAIARVGHGELAIRATGGDIPEVFDGHSGDWTVAELGAASWAAAGRIGAAFDARNGNDYRSGLLQRGRKLSEESYDVPVSTETFAALPVGRSDPSSAAGWYERACEYAALGDAELAVAAIRRALGAGDTEGGLDAAERSAAHALLLGQLVNLEAWEAAQAALAKRVAGLREQDREALAAVEERIGLAMFGRVEEADRAAVERELAECTSQTAVEVRGRLQLFLANALLRQEQPDTKMILALLGEAISNLDDRFNRTALISALGLQSQFEAMYGHVEVARDALARIIELALDSATLANALSLRARISGGNGELVAGVKDADEAMRLFVALDASADIVNTSQLTAALLTDAGRHSEAASRLRYAVTVAERLEAVPSGLSQLYGCALVRAGRGPEAAEVLSQTSEDLRAEGAPPATRADALYWLGHALVLDEQYDDAVGAWVSAVDLFDVDEHPRGAAMAGAAAGGLLARFGEHDEALEFLTDAAEQARKDPDDTAMLAGVLQTLGQTQANSGSDGGLVTLDEALALAHRLEAAWLIADVTDSKARALAVLERSDEALPLFLAAADGFVDAGDSTSAGVAELAAARLLVQASSDAEAVAIYRSALDHAAEGHPDLTSLLAIELGDVLERLGRTDEAATARALAQQDI